uniref:Uncharacterized protein n=1 Tax=Globodera rostochiensis TaxID=31243 RepID=A0A914IE43_GLORO
MQSSSPLGANVFLTGANRGIGLGLVKEILKIGGVTNLFAGCREPDQAQELKELAKRNKALKLVKIDVSSDESIKNAVSEVCKVLGSDDGLNTLINNAGILEKEGGTLKAPDRAVYLRHFDVNVVGTVATTAAFLPLLRKTVANSGAVVRVNVAYGMSKAAMHHFSKMFSVDEPDIVSVAIHPGWIVTDMGGPNAPVTLDERIPQLVKLIGTLTKADSGKLMDHEKEIEP